MPHPDAQKRPGNLALLNTVPASLEHVESFGQAGQASLDQVLRRSPRANLPATGRKALAIEGGSALTWLRSSCRNRRD